MTLKELGWTCYDKVYTNPTGKIDIYITENGKVGVYQDDYNAEEEIELSIEELKAIISEAERKKNEYHNSITNSNSR